MIYSDLQVSAPMGDSSAEGDARAAESDGRRGSGATGTRWALATHSSERNGGCKVGSSARLERMEGMSGRSRCSLPTGGGGRLPPKIDLKKPQKLQLPETSRFFCNVAWGWIHALIIPSRFRLILVTILLNQKMITYTLLAIGT